MPDREKLIKHFEHLLNAAKGNYQDFVDLTVDVGEEILFLLKEQEERWIPVTERLPRSMANKVLVYVQHEDYVGYIGYGHYEKYKGQEMWFDLEHDEEFSKRGYTVTHWMEMPMPPMEGAVK